MHACDYSSGTPEEPRWAGASFVLYAILTAIPLAIVLHKKRPFSGLEEKIGGKCEGKNGTHR